MLHAGWNFFTKKSNANKISVLWLAWLIAGIAMLPIAIRTTDFTYFSANWILYLIYTGIIHALYLYLLGHSYSIGEMSVIYPISRGLGILITVFLVLSLDIDHISANGVMGVIIILIGILLVAIKRIRDLEKRSAMVASAKVGICISLYSIVDKLSVQVIPPVFYITMMFITTTAFLAPIMLLRLKTQTIYVYRHHKLYSGAIGIVSLFTYLLILFAMQDTPTSYVVALREFSIVFGSILGMWFFREETNKRKVAGIIIIVIGAFVIKAS